MPLSDVAEWFPPPILRVRREDRFWFLKAEDERPIADSSSCNQCTVASIMLESVGEKLHKYFLEQLRINVQYLVLKLHVPCDLVVFFWKVPLDLRAHVGQKFAGRITNYIRGNFSYGFGKQLQSGIHP